MWTKMNGICLLFCAIGTITAQRYSCDRAETLKHAGIHLKYKYDAETLTCPELSWNPPGRRVEAARGYEAVCTAKTQYGNRITVSKRTKENERIAEMCLPAALNYVCKVYALDAESRRSLLSKECFVKMPPGGPCKPVIALDSRDGNHVRIKWKLDCNGGFPVQYCQLQRNFKPLPSRHKMALGCKGNGVFSFADDTIKEDTAYHVLVYTFDGRGHKMYDSKSEILTVEAKDLSLSGSAKVAIAFAILGGVFMALMVGLVIWRKGYTTCLSRDFQVMKGKVERQESNISEISVDSDEEIDYE